MASLLFPDNLGVLVADRDQFGAVSCVESWKMVIERLVTEPDNARAE
ncbi:hypothetical protein ABIA39_000760 [Nocardia sp. GAS34]